LFTDINQCLVYNNNCSQTCANIWGGAICGCLPGFNLTYDHITCTIWKVIGSNTGQVKVTDWKTDTYSFSVVSIHHWSPRAGLIGPVSGPVTADLTTTDVHSYKLLKNDPCHLLILCPFMIQYNYRNTLSI